MTADVIDLLFSFTGRIGRTWWLGFIALAAVGIAGVRLFNEDSFDESAIAIAGGPTMAAFLWALLCLFVLTGLPAKRLADRSRPRWPAQTLSIPGAILLSGWGLGFFVNPLAPSRESLVFWGLRVAAAPAMLECAAFAAPDGRV